MSKAKSTPKIVIVTGIGVALGIAGLVFLVAPDQPAAAGTKMPELSPMALAGARAFDANCAKCHGQTALGTEQGPAFLHPVYNAGHHSDEAFRRAVAQGTRQHHWRFGDMPAQPQVTPREVSEIIRYVRELQEANGIVAQPHNM